MDNYISLLSAVGVFISVVLSGYGIVENYRKSGRSDLQDDYSRVKTERDELRKQIESKNQQIEFYKDIIERRGYTSITAGQVDISGDMVGGDKRDAR